MAIFQLPRYQNQGEKHKILLKLAEFQSMLNGLHDFGLDETSGIGEKWLDNYEKMQPSTEDEEMGEDENFPIDFEL